MHENELLAHDDPVVGLFMQMALAEAEIAGSEGEVPVGAIVVHQGRVIGPAAMPVSVCKTQPRMLKCWRLPRRRRRWGRGASRNCQLFVTLEPCPMCMGASLNARISQVFFAAHEPKSGACGSCVDLSAPPGFNHRIDVQQGPLGDTASQLLKDFFRKKRDEKNALIERR